MKYNLIKTSNYLLITDNSEIKIVDWAIHNSKKYREEFNEEPIRANKNNVKTIQEHWDKIIAHVSLNGAPVLEGVPSLPPLEDDVEKLASKHANLKSSIHDYDENYFNSHGVAIAKGFISGYNKNHEKYKFTEEDIRQAYLFGKSMMSPKNFEKYLQSLQQPKLPIAFECDEKYIGGDIDDSDDYDERDWGVKTFINSEGRTEWVGKYIYE
jgi:hypothetical protein